jgi:hypothetical protein
LSLRRAASSIGVASSQNGPMIWEVVAIRTRVPVDGGCPA